MTDLVRQKNEISNLIVDLLEDDSPEAFESIAKLKKQRKLIEQKITENSEMDISLQKSDMSFPSFHQNQSTNFEAPRTSLKRPEPNISFQNSTSNTSNQKDYHSHPYDNPSYPYDNPSNQCGNLSNQYDNPSNQFETPRNNRVSNFGKENYPTDKNTSNDFMDPSHYPARDHVPLRTPKTPLRNIIFSYYVIVELLFYS